MCSGYQVSNGLSCTNKSPAVVVPAGVYDMFCRCLLVALMFVCMFDL